MMARCGCQGAGSTTCEAIIRCVAGSLGPGLTYTNGRLQTRLSRDGGNCLRYGSDQGLYAPCDGDGGGGSSGRTVAGLPDQVFGGIGGGAGLVQPYGSPAAIEYCVANRIDIIAHQSWALADNVAAWGPAPPTRTIDTWARTPSTEQGRLLTSEMYTGLEADAGAPGVNPTGRYSDAPEALLTPDGGWYGFYARPFPPLLTTQMFQLVNARSVVLINNASAANFDTQSNINAILAVQAQEWVIVDVPPGQLASVPLFLDAGINHISVNVGTNTDITPAQVTDTGATWVRMHYSNTDARITEFVDSGLQVLAGYDSRQTTAQRLDPVYTRGVLGDPWLDYRVNSMSFQTRQAEIGMLTERTDRQSIDDGRGYPKQNEHGRFFPAMFNWSNGVGRSYNNQLMGKLGPIPDPNEYSITMSVQVDQNSLPPSNTPKLGFIVGNDNDLDVSNVLGATDNATRHGYAAFIRVGSANANGRLELGVFGPTGAYTQLAVSTTQQPVTANTWVTLEVEILDDNITLRRTDTGTTYEVTASNTNWRGPYAYYMWEDQNTGGTGGAFSHGYRDVNITSGTPTATDWAVLEITYEDWAALAADNPTWANAEAGPFA
jgi:hypothetical protein